MTAQFVSHMLTTYPHLSDHGSYATAEFMFGGASAMHNFYEATPPAVDYAAFFGAVHPMSTETDVDAAMLTRVGVGYYHFVAAEPGDATRAHDRLDILLEAFV